MQGQQDAKRVLYDTVDLESLIRKDHLLRRIDKLIDIDFFYEIPEELYNADNGRLRLIPCYFSACN